MMSLLRGWGWQPPQTASCVHIIHTQKVWAHWYAVHLHMAVFSNTYTHTTWVRFWGSGSLLVESKWCHYIMVEADSHLKILHVSTLYIHKVFEHIDMLSMGIWRYSQILTPTLIKSDFGVLGHFLWSRNDVITSWLRVTATSKWCHYVMVEADSHLKLLPVSTLYIYKEFEHIDMLSMGIWQ